MLTGRRRKVNIPFLSRSSGHGDIILSFSAIFSAPAIVHHTSALVVVLSCSLLSLLIRSAGCARASVAIFFSNSFIAQIVSFFWLGRVAYAHRCIL